MEVNILTKRNIQPNILSHMGQYHRGEKSAVEKSVYNNGPTKDVSFRGSAVIKASDYLKAITKSGREALKAKKLTYVPEYANKIVESTKFDNIIDKTCHNEGLVEAAIVLGLTTTIKPLCTLIIPGTKKDDKEVLATKHILSGLIGYGFSKLLYTPFAKAIEKIRKNPSDYIDANKHDDFIKQLRNGGKFRDGFETLWKKGPDVIMSIPKSILTVALIAPLLTLLFPSRKKAKNNEQAKNNIEQASNVINQKISNDKALTFKGRQKNNDLSFTGLGVKGIFSGIKKLGSRASELYDSAMNALGEPLAKKVIGKIAPTRPAQSLSNGLAHWKHPGAVMSNLASVVLTLSLLNNTAKSKKIEKERKPYLLLNTALVTAISSTVSIIFDHCTDGMLESIAKAYMKNRLDFTDDQMVNGLELLKGYKQNGKKIFGSLTETTKKLFSNMNTEQLESTIERVDKYIGGVNKLKSYTIFSFIVRFATPLLVVPLTTKILKVIENKKKKKQEVQNTNSLKTTESDKKEEVKKA